MRRSALGRAVGKQGNSTYKDPGAGSVAKDQWGSLSTDKEVAVKRDKAICGEDFVGLGENLRF